MSIKLVATDLDGTMLATDNSIPESNLEAITSIQKKQIPLAICTGKSYAISKDICKKCDAHYGIFGNGTQIIDLKEQKEIFCRALSLEDLSLCYNIASKYNLHIHAYGNDFVVTENLKYLDLRNYAIYFQSQNKVFGTYDSNFNLILHSSYEKELSFYIVKNLIKYVKEHNLIIFNIVLSSEGQIENLKSEIESQTDLTVQFISKKGAYKDKIIKKEYDYLSVSPKHIGKGSAFNFLKEYLNINTNDTMAIGDNLNDIDLLKNSGIGIAVANAYEPVKKVANYTTKHSANDGGFAEAVYQFISF